MDGQIQKWQASSQGWTFLVNWNCLVGGDLESSRRNRLGKMGMSSPGQTEEMAGCGLGRWFDMSG